MSLKKLIPSYACYNHWANGKMTGWLKTIESSLLQKETRSSFGSIHLTLEHMNEAQDFWFAVITEGDFTKRNTTQKLTSTDIVISKLLIGSQQMLIKVNEYNEDDLLKQLPSSDMIQSRYDYILHVVNHNSYHRGQLVTMSRCLGVVNNIPAMDYEVFLWEEQTKKRAFSKSRGLPFSA